MRPLVRPVALLPCTYQHLRCYEPLSLRYCLGSGWVAAIIWGGITNLLQPVPHDGLALECLDVTGAVQVLLGFLLQSGEVSEVADDFGGFGAVAVVDGDGSAKCLDGLGVRSVAARMLAARRRYPVSRTSSGPNACSAATICSQ